MPLRFTDGGPIFSVVVIIGGYLVLAYTYQRKPQYNVNPTRWWVKDGGALSSQLVSFHNTYTQCMAIMSPAVMGTILCPFTLAIRPAMAECLLW